MNRPLAVSTVNATLPLVYSIASALTLVYLSKRRVHLSQYEALRESDEADDDDEEEEAAVPPATHSSSTLPHDNTTNIDVLQAQYQAQQNAGISISLARLGLTFTQLGLIVFSTVFTTTLALLDDTRSITAFDLGEIVQVLSWSYILVLTLVHLIRPKVSSRFWIRPQMDLFYLLQWILLTISLVQTQDVYDLPMSEWSLGLRLTAVAWLVDMTLLWTTVVTRPYQPLPPASVIMKLKAGEIPRLPSSEYSSSLYARLTYTWVNSLVYLGFKRTLQDNDLPNLEDSDRADQSIRIYSTQTGKTFTRRLLSSLKWEFFWQFMWTVPWCVCTTAAPYCLNKIIQYIECKDCGPPALSQYVWVFALLAASIIESLCFQSSLHYGRRIYVHTTSICNAAVFAKALKRKDMASPVGKSDDEKEDDEKKKDTEDKKKDNSANISNLVAVDIKKLEMPFSYVFMMYGTPIQFLIAGVQLYNLLGNAALVGVAFMIASYPIPAKLYAMIMKLFKDIMNTKDERMDALNEMLGAIRIVKFFGWEAQFVKKITAAREKELKRTKDSYVQIVFADIVWMLTPLLNTVVILLAYTKLFGNEITASKIFTTLALFNIMRQALNSLPWNIKSTMQAIVSLNRINKFLSDEEIVQDTTVTKLDPKARLSSATLSPHSASLSGSGTTITTTTTHPTIGFVNASFTWPNKEHDVETKETKKKPSWVQRIKSTFSKKSSAADQEPVVAEIAAPQERFKLKSITADFPVGQLSLVVGPTGSGKSALLLALLGELEKLEGNMYLPRLDYPTSARSRRQHHTGGSGIAYVSQTAWLQNTTIRDNILFGKAFDQDRYEAVIEGCALVTDFEILESGDKTEIGEQGITLSGGQKQRVSLARAIYSDANVLLLDDCLSAVDSHTGKHLFQTLTGPLLDGRTVVMATHQVQLTLSAASVVLVLNKGEVLGIGTPEEAVLKEWVENVTLNSSAQSSDDSSEISTLNGESKSKKDQDSDKKKMRDEKISVKLTEEEKKQEGAVAWRVYKIYLNASGGWIFWLGLIGIFFLREIVDVGQNAWLAVWANKMAENTGAFVIKTFNTVTPAPLALSFYGAFAPRDGSRYGVMTMNVFGKGTPETVSVDFYLGVYVLLSICAMILGSLNLYYVVMGGLAASRVLHERLLKSITRAKVRFFDTTPMGRIVNRFSSDISTIDDEVSNGIQGLFGCVTTLTGIIVIISVNMPIFLVAAFFIVIIYGVIGALYVPVSRDLKRLNSNSKSPILNHFNESLNGLATIRAYGFQKRFLSKSLTNLDDNNRTFFLLWSTNRWLHWRVDVVGASVAFITGNLVLQNWGLIEPGWAALSLTYSLMFTGNVVWFIRMYAMNEMNLNSVERVVEYMDLEPEPDAIIEGSRPPASWPHAGEIVVDHLTMRYAPDTPEVIKDVSLTIRPGEKVGVVGRTGSGKSTLAISLFRFMDPAGGSIIIDGIDICKIGLQDLRSNLTIIPQDPILFKGTLRSNLDPFGEREDRELWEALRRSHLIPGDKSLVVSAVLSKRNSLEITSAVEAGPSAGTSSSSATKSPTSSIKDSKSSSSDSNNPNEIVDSSKITLDTPVKENGSNFSQGQRQLIALARALVRQSKIIVMDEATASVDFETDLKIQMTIREEMADATILTIAHRIRTIADFDRVLVMNAGEVAEFDRPYTLMRQEDSLFRSMCERSSEFEALLTIAEEKEKRDRVAGLV
ncbi:hypothetical protein BGX33_005482 [Mortierella sp. NVP41]|nr:hypothetical protein BGX33_005482 [Mortierella sp. NVP41]